MRIPLPIWSRCWLVLTVMLALAACAVEEPPAPALIDPTGFASYVHPSGVFSLSLPPDWVISDTSDDYALNVAFSPPNASEPLVSVYVVSVGALGQAHPGQQGMGAGTTTDMERLIALYQATFYAQADATYKEIGRDVQPDGSLRIRFLIDGPEGTSQHNDFVQIVGQYFVALRTRLPDNPAQLRTLSRIVNALKVDPVSTWASALSQGTEGSATQQVVGFSGLNAWVDSTGGFVIVGQVINHADTPLEFVRINARLFDGEGSVLLEQDDFVSSDLIQPGERTPFSIVFSDGLPPGTVRYDLDASARYADAALETFYGPENFALTSEAGFDGTGVLVVSGQVRNEGNLTARLVKVIVTVLDAEQRVVATDTTLVDVQSLAPGETSPFSVRFFELGGTPSTFLVAAQGIIGG